MSDDFNKLKDEVEDKVDEIEEEVKEEKEEFLSKVKDALKPVKDFFDAVVLNFNQVCDWLDNSVLVNVRKSHLSLIGVLVALLIWVL